jgi:hypothetical protein
VRGQANSHKRLTALTISLLLSLGHVVVAQPDSAAPPKIETAASRWETDLQIKKLTLEINDLGRIHWSEWLAPTLTLMTAILGAAVSYWLAKRTSAAALDQMTHEKRLACYPKLVKATAPFAIFFPNERSNGIGTITPLVCQHGGRALSDWYFEEGGLLLSEKARDAYFDLAEALVHASRAKELAVPKCPDDYFLISKDQVDEYRLALTRSRSDVNNIKEWKFNIYSSQEPAEKFKD